jgi:hypothetical protein
VTGVAPRAAGVRIGYADVPPRVRAWVDGVLGSPVREWAEQVGGMSPGCATRVVTADGNRAFVKAVGPELNPATPDMFRTEVAALRHLGSGSLWADLYAALDEPGGWVALVLEDVPGRHADLGSRPEADRVLAATDELSVTLAGRGTDAALGRCADTVRRWSEVWQHVPPAGDGVLPSWVSAHAGRFARDHARLVEAATAEQLVHGDLRNDNLLVLDDGAVVFVDWGGCRLGPAWFDPLLLRLEWVEHPEFDEMVRESPALTALGEDLVTAFLVGVGAWLGWRSTVAVDVNLPTLNEFRVRESARLLEGARRRLGV